MRIAHFVRLICLNHEQIPDVALFYRATRAICSWLLFCHEQPEQIAHSCSFIKSDESDPLMVVLFKEQCEQIAHSHSLIWAILNKRAKSERTNSQLCVPVHYGTVWYKSSFFISTPVTTLHHPDFQLTENLTSDLPDSWLIWCRKSAKIPV